MRRVSSAVRLRFWPDVAGQKLAPRFEGPVIWGGFRREPAGNRGLGTTGWGHAGVGMEECSAGGRVRGASRCGSLTVGEVSSGGAWPGSRVRYDEGGHSGRFRLGRLGLVQSRRYDGRGDGPFCDGRQDVGNL